MGMREYVTRAAHRRADGTAIPAGTPCRAQRSPDGTVIALSFEDGSGIALDGNCWYLEGLEHQRKESHVEEIFRIEDEVAIAAINRAIEKTTEE